MINEVKKILAELTGKRNIYITRRGNISILKSLRYAKEQGYNKIFLQDQGGWMTYDQFANRLKLNINFIKTDYGIVKGKFSDGIFLINTMPGYAALQDTALIETKNSIIINDVSGSIGNPQTKWGDIIIGSFGKAKPVNLEKGGFIATDFDFQIEEEQLIIEETLLLKNKLETLQDRIKYFDEINNKIKKDLKDYKIIHSSLKGINVIVLTPTQKEKDEIINYCNDNNLEFTECPRYIRVNENAISIEVKRK